MENKSRRASDLRLWEIERTVYGQIFAQGKKIVVTTRSGWKSKETKFSCDESYPAGIWVHNGSTFIPLDAIDHIDVIKASET